MPVHTLDSPRTAFISLFEPIALGYPNGTRPNESDLKFRLTAYLPDGDIPDWAQEHAKDASWNGCVPGKILNLTSLYRVPVYGITGEFIRTARDYNFSPDYLLRDTPARVFIGATKSKSPHHRSYLNLLAVQFLKCPPPPSLDGFLADMERFYA